MSKLKENAVDAVIEDMSNSAAEQSVIGNLLLNPLLMEGLELAPEDFQDTTHKIIFEYIRTESLTSAVDIALLSSLLSRKTEGRQAPDKFYDFMIAITESPDASRVKSHAEIISGHAYDRRIAQVASQIQLMAINGESPAEKLAKIDGLVNTLGASVKIKAARSISDVADEAIANMKSGKSSLSGYTTGFRDLDAIVTKVMPGELIIIAGRPGMGKTALAMAVADAISTQAVATTSVGTTALVFSMEMPDTQLATRKLAEYSGVDSRKIRAGDLSDADYQRLTKAAADMKTIPMFIDDVSGLTPEAMSMKIKSHKRKHGPIACIVVDDLQLMTSTDPRKLPKDRAADASAMLKRTAKEEGCPVFALSQLSRDCEKRVDKRPMPSDLRDSGTIEQDADSIWFVYRDEVYNPLTQEPGVAEIIVAKNRSGAIGTAKLSWEGKSTSFADRTAGFEGFESGIAPGMDDYQPGVDMDDPFGEGEMPANASLEPALNNPDHVPF